MGCCSPFHYQSPSREGGAGPSALHPVPVQRQASATAVPINRREVPQGLEALLVVGNSMQACKACSTLAAQSTGHRMEVCTEAEWYSPRMVRRALFFLTIAILTFPASAKTKYQPLPVHLD